MCFWALVVGDDDWRRKRLASLFSVEREDGVTEELISQSPFSSFEMVTKNKAVRSEPFEDWESCHTSFQNNAARDDSRQRPEYNFSFRHLENEAVHQRCDERGLFDAGSGD